MHMETKPLEGHVAIITGAGRGIGRSIALALAGAGAHVALAARSPAELQAVQADVVAGGGQAAVIPTDMGSEADVVRLARETVERFGRLDIVVNNAGMGTFGPLEQMTVEQWDRMMAVNARGPFILCREALPHLRRRERAFIVNISSVTGLKGYPGQAGYGASKHALMGMTKTLARELQGGHIRVHALCPGSVDTELIGQARPDLDRSLLMKPEEIADIVLFLVTRRGNAMIDQIEVHRATAVPWA
jgi:3-oxoacyl-[acyl-carrier protein] reductase